MDDFRTYWNRGDRDEPTQYCTNSTRRSEMVVTNGRGLRTLTTVGRRQRRGPRISGNDRGWLDASRHVDPLETGKSQRGKKRRKSSVLASSLTRFDVALFQPGGGDTGNAGADRHRSTVTEQPLAQRAIENRNFKTHRLVDLVETQ